MAVLVVAADNGGGGGAHNLTGVSDSHGNTWTLRQSPLFDPGAAAAGVQGVIATTNQDAGTLTTGSTITVTFGNTSSPARAWTLTEVTKGASAVVQYVTGGVNTGAATASPTVTTASLTSGDAVIGGLFNEQGTGQTVTGDSDTSNGNWSTQQTNEIGTTAAGMSVASQGKVVTGNGTQTYNPTLGVSSDVILAWIQLREQVLNNYTLTAEALTLTLAGGAANMSKGRILVAEGLTLTVAGGQGNVVDEFTDTAGTTLAAHAPSGGGAWSAGVGNMPVINDANGCRAGGTAETWTLHSKQPPSADYSVYALVVARLVGTDNQIGVGGRIADGATAGYSAVLRHAATGTVRLIKRVASTSSQLQSVSFTLTNDQAYLLELRMSGTSIKVFVDGVEVCSRTDADVTDAGRAGVFLDGAGTQDNTCPYIDYFDTSFHNATQLRKGWRLDAASLALSLSGGAVAMSRGVILVASGLTLTLTGGDNTGTHEGGQPQNYTLTADSLSLSLTGGSASMSRGVILMADGLLLTLAGGAASLLKGWRLPLDLASITLAGGAVNLLAGRVLTASGLTLMLTGNDAGLLRGRRLVADGLVLGLTQPAAGLLAGHRLDVATASFTMSGAAANLLLGRKLSAEAGIFTIAGGDVEFTHGVPGAYELDAGSLTLTFTGAVAGLLHGRRLALDGASLLVTGGDAALLHGRLLQAAGGSFPLVGGDNDGSHGAAPGQYTLVAEGCTLVIVVGDTNFQYGRLQPGSSNLLSPYPTVFTTLAQCDNEIRRLQLAYLDPLVMKDAEALNAMGWMRMLVRTHRRALVAAGVTQ